MAVQSGNRHDMADAFKPHRTATATLAATAASGRVALVKPAKGPFQVRVANAGPNTAFIVDGDVTCAAVVAGDLPILAGAIEVLTIDSDPNSPVTHIAAICAATETAALYFSAGEGL